MAIKYKDFEKREQLRKDYIDKAAEAAKTQANAYTDEQIRNIPAPPAPDIPTALPQKYEAFKVQLVQGEVSQSSNQTWEEYHKPLWNGNIVLTTGTWDNSFVTDTIIDYPEVRKYSLLLTVGGVEKELKYVSSSTEYNTYACTENGTVVLNAAVQKMNVRNNYYNNTTTVYVYCPTGSALIGQSLTAAHYGKKQYVYTLMYPEAVLQQPSETENTRFLTMCKSIATKNAKLKLTLTDNVIEANYANISNELVTTDYVNGDNRIRWIGIVADRVPNKANGTDIHDDMPTCIKGVLEVEYTDEEATQECVYDKIQGESYTFKIGDFNHEESSAFDYYFNGAILIPFSNAQIQASFTYRPVSGTENTIQVKSMVNNGQMLPYFDISELFGQAANTVMATITSNTAIENVDMGGRPVTTIALTSNVQNFTDANDEIMVGQILTLTPSSLPQTYKKKAVTLATSGWTADNSLPLTFPIVVGPTAGKRINGNFSKYRSITDKSKWNCTYQETVAGEINTNTFRKADNIYEGTDNISVSFVYSSSSSVTVFIYDDYIRFSAQNTATITSLGAGVAIQKQSYTDTDVKVNSEVRFTLDEANGKLAGQFGLKKTIDKEAGKLTFTADTLPTSAITGTLEIGDTSTEGAAFVDGIATSVNGGEASSGGTVTSVSVKMNGADKGTVTTSGTIDLGTVLTSWEDVGSEAVISIIGKALYPVGAIYMSTANVNPSTFITGTTWVAWGSGRVPVGIDMSDTDFNGVEKTGGEKTHTLTESEMPAHKHTGTEQEAQKFNIEQGSNFETKRYTASFTSETMQTASNSVANPNGSLSGNGEVVVEHGITAGGGQPHSILQPYITCYMWKRTA